MQLRFKNPAMRKDSLFNTAGLICVNSGLVKNGKEKNTKKYIHRVLESIDVNVPFNCVTLITKGTHLFCHSSVRRFNRPPHVPSVFPSGQERLD